MHDDDLSQRLLLAESDFLTALESGTKMLSTYHQTWSALSDALSIAKETKVDNDKWLLVNFTASRISNLASCFLDIRREEKHFTFQLQSDCDVILCRMNALDLNPRPKSSSRTLPVDPTPAYQWLLDNLHNPYPTAEVKAQIATASACRVPSVSSWFTNARRRIGWTNLCRERFSNCRADMLDAAYRALVKEDPERVLSPELRHSFVAMKVAAENLHPSTFTGTGFAVGSKAILKDKLEEDGKSVEVEEYTQVDKTDRSKATQHPYPSPDPSTPALVDFLMDESEEEDVAPPIIAGSKRRRSSIDSIDQSLTANRPMKRLRVSTTSQACLPSPPASTGSVFESLDPGSPELPSARPMSFGPGISRERRLSVVDATAIPKNPNDSMVLPCPQAAFDPVSRPEQSIDDWFKANFDDLFTIPPPVDTCKPDLSATWEVELFKDYSIPGNAKYTPTVSANAHIPTDLSDFDSLLQSIGGHTFTTPSESVLPSSINGVAYTTVRDPPIPDISQSDLDWMALLMSPDAHQPTGYSTFPEYPKDSRCLPEIDLSMLQLPHVVPAVNSQGNFASQQAKLHQFHAMQEAVWRMEQELRSEGFVI